VRDVVEVHLPRPVHRVAVLLLLARGERLPFDAMDRHRHDVRPAVRNLHAGLRQRRLHQVTSGVAHRMSHVLPRGGDAAQRGVVVGPEMCARNPATAGCNKPAQCD
jgi:hypothetical protein